MTKFLITACVLLATPCTAQQIWTSANKLRASDGQAGELFGNRVALDGDRAVIGAWFDDDLGVASGSVYIFQVSNGQERLKLAASDGEAYDFFGCSVAIEGGLAVVGARGDDFVRGAAYVYEVESGVERFKLTAPDADMGDEFGVAVAISGNRILVGARFDDDNGSNSGSAYVFDAATGGFLLKLTPTDGATGDQFGESVAISGTRAVVGAPRHDQAGTDSGSAYVFDVTTGQQLFELTVVGAAADDRLGTSVALDGDRALAGAPNDDDLGAQSGSAYLFDATTGSELLKWTDPAGGPDANFGGSLDLSDRRAVVAAANDNDLGASSGSAHVFDVTTGQWRAQLNAYDAAPGDHFGVDVGIDGVDVLVGADLDNDLGAASGSAYPFELVTIGANYCTPAVPNSTGQPASISAHGSFLLGDDEVTLTARGLPPGEFGYFLVGRTPGFFQPPGSAGILCLAGNIGRYNRIAEIIDGPGGFLEVDLAAIPINPPTPVVPGDSWNFQCWFRDAGTSNFTDAVIVTLF